MRDKNHNFAVRFCESKGKYRVNLVFLYCFLVLSMVLFQQQSKSKALELWNV